MSKFNVAGQKAAVASPITTEQTPSITTHEGAPGYVRDPKAELFLLGVSNMVKEKTFYESGADRDRRYKGLIAQVAVADPDWMARFLAWLRSDGNMRSAPLVGALEAAKALLAAKIPGARQIVASVLQRADEPGEALAYWTTTYGRSIPKPIKRGVADAATRLYNEYAMLKYDTPSKRFRFADVLELTHPTPVSPWQGALFQYALERRHGRAIERPEVLPMVSNQANLREAARHHAGVLLDPVALKSAGMTWEDALSLAGPEIDKAALWEALIPSMGYMALLRNLRNFDEAGISAAAVAAVTARLEDPGQVARSRQFPFRFLAAYEQVPSVRWAQALDTALNLSLSNIPALPGRTLVLIDTSASMTGGGFSRHSTMTPAKAAAVFGVALAMRSGADLYGFADGVFEHKVPKGASLIREVDKFVQRTGEVGHGTQIAQSLHTTYRGHDRVFVISDMQTMRPGTDEAIPASTMLYGFNLGGYKAAAFPTGLGTRHEFGGLTDATFKMVPLLEAGRNAAWPF